MFSTSSINKSDGIRLAGKKPNMLPEDGMPEKEVKVREDRQTVRRRTINDVCRRRNLTDVEDMLADRADGGVLHHLIVDDVDRTLYCYIPKVACTNWKRTLMVLMGKTNATDPMDVDRTEAHQYKTFRRLNNYTRSEAEFVLANYTKFLFVRHPMERFLSAYRNKFADNMTVNARFRAQYGRKIIERYRVNATKESLELGHDVTFDEFTRFVTDPKTDERPLNEHWRPMVELCRPCEIQYDLIGKYETLDDDTRLVLNAIGPNRDIKFPTQPSANNSLVIKSFYQALPKAQLQKIYSLFELDFRLFGYDHINLT